VTAAPEIPTAYHGYDASTAPKGMLRHVKPILGYPGVIARNTTLLANFLRRDLFGRFRGSLLGIVWVLLQPLFLFAIYFFVFGYLFAARTQTGPNVSFALYLFSGIIVFSSFTEATTRACNLVLENGNLVKKVAFPCELLPIPSILVSMIVYLVGALIVFVIGFSQDQLALSWDMLAWPLVLGVHFLFSLGFGLFLACTQVFLRDTTHLYSIFQQAWFFLSPVFWPYHMLEGKLGTLAWIVEVNPMYPLIQAHRLALGYGYDHANMRTIAGEPLPSVWYHLGLASLWAVVFLVIGYSFFMSRKRKFSDLV
jgi:lipopolysaccharide transport system permease protein